MIDLMDYSGDRSAINWKFILLRKILPRELTHNIIALTEYYGEK